MGEREVALWEGERVFSLYKLDEKNNIGWINM